MLKDSTLTIGWFVACSSSSILCTFGGLPRSILHGPGYLWQRVHDERCARSSTGQWAQYQGVWECGCQASPCPQGEREACHVLLLRSRWFHWVFVVHLYFIGIIVRTLKFVFRRRFHWVFVVHLYYIGIIVRTLKFVFRWWIHWVFKRISFEVFVFLSWFTPLCEL